MNTRVIEQEFVYSKPKTLTEALEILAGRENVKVYAGGTDLIVKLKTSSEIKMDLMVDINGIPGLNEIASFGDRGSLIIGSTAKLSQIEKYTAVRTDYTALYEALVSMASVSVRNMGTLGGNFANASPAADTAGPVICYNGIVELRSREGVREVPAEDFFISSGISVIRPGELITAIILPALKDNTGAKFIKFGRVKADIAKVSFSVVIERDGNKIKSCRTAMGAVAAKPLYIQSISESLAGRMMTRELIQQTSEKISDFIKPIDDIRSTADYRKDITKVIVADGLEQAWKRSGGELS